MHCRCWRIVLSKVQNARIDTVTMDKFFLATARTVPKSVTHRLASDNGCGVLLGDPAGWFAGTHRFGGRGGVSVGISQVWPIRI